MNGAMVVFLLLVFLVVAAVVYRYPRDSFLGWGILLCGLPVYLLRRSWRAR